jgi:hypothetical protein
MVSSFYCELKLWLCKPFSYGRVSVTRRHIPVCPKQNIHGSMLNFLHVLLDADTCTRTRAYLDMIDSCLILVRRIMSVHSMKKASSARTGLWFSGIDHSMR